MLPPVSTSESIAEASNAIDPVISQPASLTTTRTVATASVIRAERFFSAGAWAPSSGSWGIAFMRKGRS